MTPTPAVVSHTPISLIRGIAALMYLVIAGLISSILVIPLVVFGGRRNRTQHFVERLWASGVLKIAGIRVVVKGQIFQKMAASSSQTTDPTPMCYPSWVVQRHLPGLSLKPN